MTTSPKVIKGTLRIGPTTIATSQLSNTLSWGTHNIIHTTTVPSYIIGKRKKARPPTKVEAKIGDDWVTITYKKVPDKTKVYDVWAGDELVGQILNADKNGWIVCPCANYDLAVGFKDRANAAAHIMAELKRHFRY